MATSAGTIPISATFNGAQLEKDVLSALNRIQSKSTLNLNTRNFTQPLGKITGLANEFNKSLEASNARVVAFGASAGLIFAVQKSFTALVASTIEVEKSLTDINIVLNTSSKGIKQFGDQLFDVARQTGAAFKDVAGAATEFSRQGLGLQETLKRTRDALILTRLSGLDVVSSTEALTAAVNSFTKEALTTTDVVNKLAAVDAKFAVSSRDLSEALQRVGSSASEAGVSFDELLGIVTSVQQTTARGGAVIGNALKTIFTRIERPQVIRDLKDFGITVSDISGNALPTIKVIENLAQSFQNLNPVIKSQVAELVGGVYQINILKAALSDVSKQNSAFAEATRTSSKAADEAIIKNDALNKSLSALINETTVNFTQFASKIGDVSIAPGIRKVLNNIVNPALESFNNKEVEGVGAKIATGLLTGLTDFITGPGLGLGALAIGKLIANFTGFAGDAAKNLLGVGKDQAIIQGEISKILSSNPQLIQQIIAGSKSRLQVEKEIKQILIEQAAISKSIKDNSKDITGRFLASGLTVSPETGLIGGRRSAGGYIPAKQQAAEMVGAMQGGYAPGKVVAAPKSIGGIMNTAETVKYVPGFAQPYILPPQGSRAARDLTSRSMSKNGINPYKARGFVPNFAGTDFTNPYGYGDDQWFRDNGKNPFPVPLSQIKITNKAGDESGFDGKRFYKKNKNGEELKFTATDLNAFLKRGATYGELRRYVPDSILRDDPRYKSGAITNLEEIRRDFAPGKKMEGQTNIKEGIKQVYESYIPPASMLVFDLDAKNKEIFADENTGEILTKRKEDGRAFKIKSYALNASALNEERTGLIQKTADFSRKVTKDLASYIRPGTYSDTSVDEFFNRAGKNYSVLAGTIFEASTNLAANYTRDQIGGGGGDFDVIGGNIGNIRQLFPGFEDQYGDYKLKNNDDALRSFIGKVKKTFSVQMSNHFKAQEKKVGQLTTGFQTSSLGFIPNFAPKPFNFRFSNLGEKTAQISPKLRDWLADKYFDPEMASPEMLERLASLNRDSGAFFATLENPNAVAGIPVRGQQGFVSRQNRGARAGALLNALRTRLPNFVPGSLPTLASGFVPNFLKVPKVPKIKSFKTGEGERVLGPAPIVNRQTKEEFVKKVLEGEQDKSYLRYSRKDDSIDVDFVRSSRRGDGGFLWDRAGSIAKRLGLPLTTSAFLPQKKNLKKYDAETGSFEEVLATGFPQLKWSQLGKALRTKLNLYNDYLEYPIESKATFSEVKNKLNDIYKYDAPALKDSILRDNTYIQDIVSYFAKGFIPNFSNGLGLSTIRFLLKAGGKMSGSVLDPRTVINFATGNGKIEDIIQPFLSFLKKPAEFVSSKQDLNDAKSLVKIVFGNKTARETIASKLAPILSEVTFSTRQQERSIKTGIDLKSHDDNYKDYETFLRYRLLGGGKEYEEYVGDEYRARALIKNKDGSYRFNPKSHLVQTQLDDINKSAAVLFGNREDKDFSDRLMTSLSGAENNRKEYASKILGPEENIPGSNPFLGYTFKLGRFIGNLGKKRKAVRYEDKWDVDLHGPERDIMDEFLHSIESLEYRKIIANSRLHKEVRGGTYAGDINSTILRELVASIPNVDPVILRGISRIPKDQRFAKGFIPNFNSDIEKYLANFDSQTVSEFSNKNILGGTGMSVLLERLKFIKGLLNINPNITATEVAQILNDRKAKANNINFTGQSKTFSKEDARKLIARAKNNRDDLGMFSGFIPNFNPVQEAMGREMAAGYSSSQVKLGQSNKLKTSFNPMGLGVYNSTEGSLNNGIGLAEKAGINPKTKGMSAKGHIPNFAETSGFDLFALTASFSALIFSIRQTSDSLNQLKLANETIKKDNISAAASFSQKIKQIPLDFNKSQQAIRDEVKKTFTNIDPKKLTLRGGAVAPLVSGGFARDPVSGLMIRQADKAASPQQVARLEELRKQLAEARKKANEDIIAARQGRQEAAAAAKAVDAPYFGKGMFAQNSKLSNFLKAAGPGAAIVTSTLASLGGQFIPEKNKQARAVVSGVSDVAQYAGTGAVFGAPGAAIGAIVGLGFALKRFSDAKAEEAIDKINDSLDKTKEKAAEFSGAAQNYTGSLESLQSALNDPKTRPEALLKFQNNLTEALNSIPIEFKDKVLKAGTDITKVAEAIAGVNKELGNTQKNLEKQLAITQIIKEESSIFGPASVSAKNQKQLNALFASSINPESVTKGFGGGSGEENFKSFIDSLKSQAIYTRDVYSTGGGMAIAQKIGTERAVNKEAVEGIKSELKNRGILTEDIANQLDQAFSSLKPEAIESIIEALKKQGLFIIDNAKRSKILSEILEDNTKRIRRNEEALKSLSEQYNNINLQISNQIDIEKNRAKTIREINKIQAEGAVSIQRAKVKGLLDVSSQFIGEGVKNDIQNELDINEIIARQNSKVQDATNSLLDSFTEAVVKKSEEARSKAETAITDASRGPEDIQKERFRFQQTIQQLNPLISQSLKDINSGGNVGDIKQLLTNQIRTFAGFKPEERDVLIQTLEGSFEDFKNKLAEIKAQGDIDLQIQEAQREYQKQSLALNQRLSFAGGAQALGSTGKAGVSDLFDNISELVSELRQTNTIGNAAQRGSSAFKLLDVLTNQLQLNRAVQAPVPFRDAQSFNAQVSSDLGPLVGTAIAGRVQQIRESVDLARRVTEIQTGKSTAGTALGTAFDQAKESAVQTALDQVAAQFKLENMGSYLDVLQEEARFLNTLTQKQNDLLENTLPTTLNQNFKSVITEQVGNKLNTLTSSLTEVINKLSTSSQRNTLETEISNRLPNDVGPETRNRILERIKAAGELKPLQMTEIDKEGKKAFEDLKRKDEEELEKYKESLAAIRSDKEKMSGGTSVAGEEGLLFLTAMRRKYSFSGEPSAEDFAKKQSFRTFTTELPSQMVDTTKLAGTYQEFVDNIKKDFGAEMTEQQVKDLQRLTSEIRKLETAAPLMSANTMSEFGPYAGGYKFGTESSNIITETQFGSTIIPDALAIKRANIDRTNSISENLKSQQDIAALEKRVNELLKEDLKDTKKREELTKLQVKLRKQSLEQENALAKYNFDLYYKSEFGKTAFRDEKAAQANALIESEARKGNIDYKSITEKNTTYNRADFARDTGQLIDTFQTDFKSGIASAFGEAIKGTKTLKDAFRDMFQNILNRILDKSLEMGVDALFAFGKAAATGRKDGGLIRGYNSGGMVVGGSGMKDDVPAMMSGGEYVIKKSSVNKYGANYLRALNGGLVPRYATGGFSIGPLQNEFLYDNPERPTSGEYAVDSRLSAMALTDENNPQNRLREDRFNKLDQYLQDRAQYEKDKQQAIKNYKNQVNSTFYSGLAAAGIQLGTAGLTIGAEKLRTPKATVGKPYQAYSPTFSNYTGGKRANGGYIPKFAGGGYTGKDNIPALLMGGEYVMNKKSVDMYGRDFMSQLNSGTLPKYAAGGMVGTSYTGQGNPQTSIEELVSALNTLNENLSKDNGITQAESGKVSAAGATQESGMSVVNNISINVAQGGEVTSEANSTTQQGNTNTQNSQNNIQNNAKLGELLRNKVVEVLVEQKRPGGLLYASR